MPRELVVTGDLVIPAAELEWSFARSSGPGGQNVNKVNSKAILRWKVQESRVLPEAWRRRFIERFTNRLNEAGELVLASDRSRDQSANIGDCLNRLRGWLLSTQHAPIARRPTKPSRGSVERRLTAKRQRKQTKQGRRPERDSE